MSEKGPQFIESELISDDKPNLIKDLNRCVDVIFAIESEIGAQVGVQDRHILKQNISEALAYLIERRETLSKEELAKLETRSASGFQGLAGFNRYDVRGDGAIGIKRSHSFSPCVRKAQELGIEVLDYGF